MPSSLDEPIVVRASLTRRDLLAAMAVSATRSRQRWAWGVRAVSAITFSALAVAFAMVIARTTELASRPAPGAWVASVFVAVLPLAWLFAPFFLVATATLDPSAERGRRFTFASDGVEIVTPWQKYALRWSAVRAIITSSNYVYVAADSIVQAIPREAFRDPGEIARATALFHAPSGTLAPAERSSPFRASADREPPQATLDRTPPPGSYVSATARVSLAALRDAHIRMLRGNWPMPLGVAAAGVFLLWLPERIDLGVRMATLGQLALALATSSVVYDVLPGWLVRLDRGLAESARTGIFVAFGAWGALIRTPRWEMTTSWGGIAAALETRERFVLRIDGVAYPISKADLGDERSIARVARELEVRLGARFARS